MTIIPAEPMEQIFWFLMLIAHSSRFDLSSLPDSGPRPSFAWLVSN